MRIARVLGAIVTAREVEPCNPPTRLRHPADTPLSDHSDHSSAIQPLPVAPVPIAPGRGAPAQGQRSVVIVTRTVRRCRVR
jgi:hypothetical protein